MGKQNLNSVSAMVIEKSTSKELLSKNEFFTYVNHSLISVGNIISLIPFNCLLSQLSLDVL